MYTGRTGGPSSTDANYDPDEHPSSPGANPRRSSSMPSSEHLGHCPRCAHTHDDPGYAPRRQSLPTRPRDLEEGYGHYPPGGNGYGYAQPYGPPTSYGNAYYPGQFGSGRFGGGFGGGFGNILRQGAGLALGIGAADVGIHALLGGFGGMMCGFPGFGMARLLTGGLEAALLGGAAYMLLNNKNNNSAQYQGNYYPQSGPYSPQPPLQPYGPPPPGAYAQYAPQPNKLRKNEFSKDWGKRSEFDAWQMPLENTKKMKKLHTQCKNSATGADQTLFYHTDSGLSNWHRCKPYQSGGRVVQSAEEDLFLRKWSILSRSGDPNTKALAQRALHELEHSPDRSPGAMKNINKKYTPDLNLAGTTLWRSKQEAVLDEVVKNKFDAPQNRHLQKMLFETKGSLVEAAANDNIYGAGASADGIKKQGGTFTGRNLLGDALTRYRDSKMMRT